MGLRSAFKAFGIGNDTHKDFLSLEGQTAIALGQPGYLKEESDDRKKAKARAEANQNEAAVQKAKNDAQDTVNQSIIDAKRKRRNAGLLPAADGLGGAPTALGQGGQGYSGPGLYSTALGGY